MGGAGGAFDCSAGTDADGLTVINLYVPGNVGTFLGKKRCKACGVEKATGAKITHSTEQQRVWITGTHHMTIAALANYQRFVRGKSPASLADILDRAVKATMGGGSYGGGGKWSERAGDRNHEHGRWSNPHRLKPHERGSYRQKDSRERERAHKQPCERSWRWRDERRERERSRERSPRRRREDWHEREHPPNRQPKYTVDYPLRDTGVIGRIIGRGGETIKKLQQDSGTRIEVDRATDRVTIRGNDDTVSHARRMLDEICSSSRSPSRAQPNERSPSPRRWRSRSPSPQRDRRPIPARQRGRHSPPREIQRRRGSHGRSPPRQRLRHSHSRERDTQERSGTISLPPLPHAWLGSVAATAVHYEAGGQWQRETLAFLMACNPLVQPDGTEFRFPPDKMLHPPGAAGGADMGAGAPYKDVYAHFSALAARTHVK
jgi:hypothetical protein